MLEQGREIQLLVPCNYCCLILQRHLNKDILPHARYSEHTFLVEIMHMKLSCERTLASFVNDGN